jgi:hypothetical protein
MRCRGLRPSTARIISVTTTKAASPAITPHTGRPDAEAAIHALTWLMWRTTDPPPDPDERPATRGRPPG